MTDEEIIRRLKAIRHSSNSQRCARMLPSLVGIQDRTGIRREHLYRIMRGERPLTESARLKLSEVFSDCITCGQNNGERTAVGSDRSVSVSTGSGSVFTVKFPR